MYKKKRKKIVFRSDPPVTRSTTRSRMPSVAILPARIIRVLLIPAIIRFLCRAYVVLRLCMRVKFNGVELLRVVTITRALLAFGFKIHLYTCENNQS